MDDLFVYLIDMPDGMSEGVCPCDDGYNIYIDKNLLREQMVEAYQHALIHIENQDFWDDTLTVSKKEFRAHNL